MAIAVMNLSVSISVVILAVLLFSPLWDKKYSAKSKYFVWLILAIRLLIPLSLTLPNIPFTFPAAGTAALHRPLNATIVPWGTDMQLTTQIAETVPSSSLTLGTLLSLIWLCGALAFVMFYIVNYLVFKRRIRPALISCEAGCQLPVYWCATITSPMLLGFFRPTILLPQCDYTSQELDMILAHEMAHYQRKDLWYKLVLMAANALHWFNPLVYLMRKQASRDLELSCDSLAVKNRDLEFRKRYSLVLLKTMQAGSTTYLSTSLSQDAKYAKKRFQNVLNTKTKKIGVIGIAVIAVAALCCGAFFTLTTPTSDYSYAKFSTLLGQPRDTVLTSLGLTASDGEETQHGKSVDFILSRPIQLKQAQYQLRLGFYNNTLVQFDYITSNSAEAFVSAKEILQQIQKSYGEPTTYPSLPNRLVNTSELPPSNTDVYEQWDANLPPPVAASLGYPDQKFNLTLRLFVSDEASRISVSYTLNRNASL